MINATPVIAAAAAVTTSNVASLLPVVSEPVGVPDAGASASEVPIPTTVMAWATRILNTPDPTTKVALTQHVYHLFLTGTLPTGAETDHSSGSDRPAGPDDDDNGGGGGGSGGGSRNFGAGGGSDGSGPPDRPPRHATLRVIEPYQMKRLGKAISIESRRAILHRYLQSRALFLLSDQC